MDEWKRRNGQIPAFGNWDYANELPITQYFECARQFRYSSSSGEETVQHHNPLPRRNHNNNNIPLKHKQEMRNCRERRCRHVNVSKGKIKTGKVYDVTEQARKNVSKQYDTVPRCAPPKLSKTAVDEDLYKISPQQLSNTKRKKMLGFISRCLVPAACVS